MQVNRELTYENDSFIATIQEPTMLNADALIKFGRNYLQQAMEDKLSAFPDTSFLQEGVAALKPLIKTLKTIDNEELDIENLSLPAANFLASVAIEHYANTLRQSAIKKK